MRLLVLGFTCFAAALAAGCSSSHGPAAAVGDGGGGDDGGSSNLTTVSFQMQETVPASGEQFLCKYVQLPTNAGFMVGAKHDYTPGSHHMLLYTTALTSIPAGGDQLADCYEGTGNNIMSNARGVLYGGQTPMGGENLPAGVGLPTTAGEVLIFQTHYLNATSAPLLATVNVSLTVDTNPSDIQQKAGIIFFYDPFIDVPAGATAKAEMRCPIPSDITLLYASSHYHSRGIAYSAWNDTAPNQLATSTFYTSNSWSSPDNAQLTMPVKAGSLIRFQCDYDNTAGTQAYFAGQSAQKNEMCMFVGLYYPEMGQAADFCLQNPDMFGNGGATCSATLSCLQACPSAGNSGGMGPAANVPSCQQSCFVQSCPSASDPLLGFVNCLDNSCKSQCATPSSSTCASCVASNCGTQYQACQSHTCP
jgi:hypothetical protein